jgi:hypothetical protein
MPLHAGYLHHVTGLDLADDPHHVAGPCVQGGAALA